MKIHKRTALIAAQYLTSWERHDLESMQEYLHPNLHFKEPLSETTGRDSFLGFAEKNLHFVNYVKIHSSFDSENEAILIYDFVFVDPIGPQKTVGHFIFEGHQIRGIELFYDPRHLEKTMSGGVFSR